MAVAGRWPQLVAGGGTTTCHARRGREHTHLLPCSSPHPPLVSRKLGDYPQLIGDVPTCCQLLQPLLLVLCRPEDRFYMPGWKRGKTLLPSHVAATAKVVPLLSAPISQEDRAKEGARPSTVHTSSIREGEHHLPSDRLHRL